MSNLIYKLDKTDNDISELLQEHKGLVYFLLSEMKQLYNQDAESAAWEGLWDAVGTFDVFSSTAFATYACIVIKNAINNVLRKQSKSTVHDSVYLNSVRETDVYAVDNYCAEDSVIKVQQIFSRYIEGKQGTIKNVLLFWYSSDFCVTVSQIAKVCGCSPSYVSRVQDGFRAYLSGKLKRE